MLTLVTTILECQKGGYNAGRKYVLGAESEEEITSIVADLKRVTKLAAKKAAARSYLGKMQKRVRKAYNSTVFQSISALLIIAVRFKLKNFT